MSIKNKYVYYPQNFDLEEFCKENKLPPNKVAGILQLFIFKPKGNKDSRDISLSSRILKENFKDIYKNILDCLIGNGVIEITEEFSDGKARKFQLTDKYQFAKGVKKYVRVGNTKPLNKVLIKDNEDNEWQKYIEELKLPKIKRTSELPKKIFLDWYSPLIKWFADGKLQINSAEAYMILKAKNLQTTEPTKYLEYLSYIDIFESKDYYLNADKNFRFYSSLTNLPKILRGSLTYDGKSLLELMCQILNHC